MPREAVANEALSLCTLDTILLARGKEHNNQASRPKRKLPEYVYCLYDDEALHAVMLVPAKVGKPLTSVMKRGYMGRCEESGEAWRC